MQTFAEFIETVNGWEKPQTSRERAIMEFAFSSGCLEACTQVRDGLVEQLAYKPVTQ